MAARLRGALSMLRVQGIAFRGHTIPELQKVLPKVDKEPLPEGLLWLLLTGEVPTAAEAESVRVELFKRSKLPGGVKKVINSLSKDMHPMTQLSIAVLAMQKHSKFAKAYQVRHLAVTACSTLVITLLYLLTLSPSCARTCCWPLADCVMNRRVLARRVCARRTTGSTPLRTRWT